MFDIGISHLIVIAVVGIIVLGPEKLPRFARDAARMLRTARRMFDDAHARIEEEIGPELRDLDLRSLDPRTALRPEPDREEATR